MMGERPVDRYFVIRKQYRISQEKVKPLAVYYVYGDKNNANLYGTVFPLPDLYQVLSTSVESALHNLVEGLQTLSGMVEFDCMKAGSVSSKENPFTWKEQDKEKASPKKQRVDDANERDEENQQSLEHLSQEVKRMTKTIEAVNGKLDDHTLPWVQSAMERHLPNILQKAVEQMSQKSVQELVGKYSQEIVKSVDTLIRPSTTRNCKAECGKKHRECFGEDSQRGCGRGVEEVQ
eukprot:g72944.t1